MSATNLGPPQTARLVADEPIVQAPPMRGVLFGLLIAVPFWLVLAGLALTLF